MVTETMLGPRSPVPVLYLDLDGTVRHGYDQLGRFVNGPADVVIFPEAVEMMRRWKADGGRVVGVSNQGGVALGYLTGRACAAAMRRTQDLTGGLFDGIAACPHHPDADEPEMARCWCRKPAPGMLIESAYALTIRHLDERYPPHLAFMVGDRDEDQGCARMAGVDFEWAEHWRARAGAVVDLPTFPAEHDAGDSDPERRRRMTR